MKRKYSCSKNAFSIYYGFLSKNCMAENHLSFPSLHIFGVFPLVFLSIQRIFHKAACNSNHEQFIAHEISQQIDQQIGSLPFSFLLQAACKALQLTQISKTNSKNCLFLVRGYILLMADEHAEEVQQQVKKSGKLAKEKSINEKCFPYSQF